MFFAAAVSHDEATFWALLCALLLLLLSRRLPAMESFERLVHLMDSRGGNIALLALLTWMFFLSGMRLIYRLLDMVSNKMLTPENAIAQVGLVFVTGTAFGGAFGALLKTLTGTASNGRSSDPTPAPAAPPPVASAALPTPQAASPLASPPAVAPPA
jgi:hypothetical protein